VAKEKSGTLASFVATCSGGRCNRGRVDDPGAGDAMAGVASTA